MPGARPDAAGILLTLAGSPGGLDSTRPRFHLGGNATARVTTEHPRQLASHLEAEFSAAGRPPMTFLAGPAGRVERYLKENR
jgi:hypothetical protein